MKNKLKAFFSKMPARKSRTGLILTIVALVEILAIMVVSTSAWIESISSIKIFTTAQTEAGGTKGIIADKLSQHVSLSTSYTTDIDLTSYFRPSGGYHLAGATSADGNVIYFPEIKGMTTANYRVGTINDKNVNYISFTVKTTSANVALAFSGSPTISFGDKELNTQSNDVKKLVRFSVGDSSGNYKVFSLADDFEEDVISAEDGTKASSIVRSFSKYAVGGSNLVTTTTANGFLTFNLWIQDPTGASSNVYNNKELKVEGLKLVAVKPFTLHATYMNDSGSYVAGTSGGSVAINDGDFGSTAVAYLGQNSTITIKASPNSTNGYSFVGWAKTISASSPDISSSSVGMTNEDGVYSYQYTFETGVYDLYAQFSDRHILNLKPNYAHNSTVSYYAYVWGTVNGTLKKEWYKGTYVNDSTGYRFTYKGNATSVIFCYMDPNTPDADLLNTEMAAGTDVWAKYRWLQTYDLSFPTDPGTYTYIVTSRRYPFDKTGTLIGYWQHSYARVIASKCSGTDSQNGSNSVSGYLDDAYTNKEGTTYVRYSGSSILFDGKTYTTNGDGDSLDYPYNAQVTLTATAGTSYNFVGWYTDAAGTTPITADTGLVSGTYNSTSITVTSDNETANNSGNVTGKTVYAKFTEKPEDWEIWYAKDSESGSWSGATLTRESSTSNYFSGSVTLTEGQDFYFKIHDKKHDTYYGLNNAFYNGYTTTPILDDGQLNYSGGNMRIRAHAGVYKFRWNYSTKKLTISVTQWNDVTITFNFSNDTWVKDYGAVVTFYDNSGEAKMTYSGNTATITVKSNRGNSTNVGFNRWDSWTSSSNHGTWRSGWTGSRGFSTTYKTNGDGKGSWQ